MSRLPLWACVVATVTFLKLSSCQEKSSDLHCLVTQLFNTVSNLQAAHQSLRAVVTNLTTTLQVQEDTIKFQKDQIQAQEENITKINSWILSQLSKSSSKGTSQCGVIQYAKRIVSFPANETYGAESFEIDGFFYIMVMSFRSGGVHGIDSVIYRFDGGTLTTYQTVPTDGAVDAAYFVIENERYLAVAQHFGDKTFLGYKVKSHVYKWNGSTFVHFQALNTTGAYDVDFFGIDNEQFLAFANFQDTKSYSTNSHVYKWTSGQFVLFQSIPSVGATAVAHIQVAESHFLAIAHFRTDSITNIDSKIYRWSGAQFEIFQSIPTIGANDVETFSSGQFTFIGFANNINGATQDINLDSKVYIWNGNEFEEFQSIPTIGAKDLEVFTACGQQYVAVANHNTGSSSDIPSVIYEVAGAGLQPYQQVTVSDIVRWHSFVLGNDTFLFAGPDNDAKDSVIFKWFG